MSVLLTASWLTSKLSVQIEREYCPACWRSLQIHLKSPRSFQDHRFWKKISAFCVCKPLISIGILIKSTMYFPLYESRSFHSPIFPWYSSTQFDSHRNLFKSIALVSECLWLGSESESYFSVSSPSGIGGSIPTRNVPQRRYIRWK